MENVAPSQECVGRSQHTGSSPVLTTKNKSMKNENLKAIVGLVLSIVLVVVMGYILILTNNI